MVEDKQYPYNKMTALPRLSYNIVSYLMTSANEKAELLWKLLKYNTTDAWKQPNLTIKEKSEMIWSGDGNINNFNVFLDPLGDDVYTVEKNILRVYTGRNMPENRTLSVQEIIVEFYAHSKMTMLSNYQTRYETAIQCIFEILNGAQVGGVGLMYYDNTTRVNSLTVYTGTSPFKGKYAVFGVRLL